MVMVSDCRRERETARGDPHRARGNACGMKGGIAGWVDHMERGCGETGKERSSCKEKVISSPVPLASCPFPLFHQPSLQPEEKGKEGPDLACLIDDPFGPSLPGWVLLPMVQQVGVGVGVVEQ